MDEPTAALGDKGLPVSLISHNMPHVFEIADRIHIQRLGKRAADVDHSVAYMQVSGSDKGYRSGVQRERSWRRSPLNSFPRKVPRR
jgi:ABC-type uncharacterized transport system ATPase subunit